MYFLKDLAIQLLLCSRQCTWTQGGGTQALVVLHRSGHQACDHASHAL